MPGKPVKILLVRQDRLGDAINAIPVLMAIKRCRPESRTAFMVSSSLVNLFSDQPYADEIVPWENDLRKLTRLLRQGHYDDLLMLHPSKILAWSALGAGIRQKTGLGFRPYYILTGFRSARVTEFNRMHEALINIKVAAMSGLCDESLEAPRIYLTDADIKPAERFLAQNSLYKPIILFPANRGSAPNWTTQRYRELIIALIGRGKSVVAVSAPGEEDRLLAATEGTRAYIWPASNNLRTLAGLLSFSSAVISSSSGGLHLAAAVGAKAIGLFCPRPPFHPLRWGPLGEGHQILVPAEERCRGCDLPGGCHLNALTVDDVSKVIGI